MTKERLEELAGSIFQGDYDWEISAENKADLEELIRLARLGLWAEETAIPHSICLAALKALS